jgi:hypothetical protein
MASGFVSYYKHNPLDILAGKWKRTYGIDKDSCWALVGALGIEDMDITYDENVPMKLRGGYWWHLLTNSNGPCSITLVLSFPSIKKGRTGETQKETLSEPLLQTESCSLLTHAG